MIDKEQIVLLQTKSEVTNCAICCEDFKIGDIGYDLKCGWKKNGTERIFHPYHKNCLSTWILQYKGTTCPTCKHSWMENVTN